MVYIAFQNDQGYLERDPISKELTVEGIPLVMTEAALSRDKCYGSLAKGFGVKLRESSEASGLLMMSAQLTSS